MAGESMFKKSFHPTLVNVVVVIAILSMIVPFFFLSQMRGRVEAYKVQCHTKQ
jgi:hypothetical protein